jgi:hypothetical protein
MVSALSEADFAAALATFEHTAFRLELQPAYQEPSERDTVRRFVSGQPQPPTEVDGLRAWFDQVSDQTRRGRRIERVRVHDEPPTDYQRWERWIGRWNVAAGEEIRYLARGRAHIIGLLPAAGVLDWWLVDDARLIVMRFDQIGQRVETWLDDDPDTVNQARTWWDLAVRYSAPDSNNPGHQCTHQGVREYRRQ